MDLESRAVRHAALSDPRRLSVVDVLAFGDATVAELAEVAGIPGNLLAHHLDVLETAGLVRRRTSEGDHRRRYVSLRLEQLPAAPRPVRRLPGSVAFVCTHNSARSQFAAALWRERTGGDAASAGSHPAQRVHPKAVQAATELGVDLSTARPGGYETLPWRPDLVVSVCDRALEGGLPEGSSHLHWSVPDPVPMGSITAFRNVFSEIVSRVEMLSRAVEPLGAT